MLYSIMGPYEEGVNSWVAKYIFLGGYIPSLRETISLLPEYDFHLLHAESLRMHYAMTLDRWYDNYMLHWAEVEENTVEGLRECGTIYCWRPGLFYEKSIKTLI